MNKFFHGSSLLSGNNTVPGVELTPELKKYIPVILKACKDYGFDFYPTIVQLLTYDEISEIAAYGGFPVRYLHWQWGMEYEELQRGYEYGHHKIYELVVNCCAPSTKVLTQRGTIDAGEVKKGDFVCGKSGWRKVALTKVQKNSKTLSIKLKDQIRELVCTPNHKWYVLTKNGYRWTETSKLKKGDVLLGSDSLQYDKDCPCNFNFDKNISIKNTKSNVRWCLKDVKIPTKMTEDLAELIGIILGDGCFANGTPNTIEISVGLEHKYYAKHIAKLFDKVFNKKASIYRKKTCFVVCVSSKYIVDFFEYAGIERFCNFNNKVVPWCVWQSSQKYRIACLKGLYDTDECTQGTISYSSKSKNLIKDIQLMLSEIGIYTSFKHVNNKYNDIYTLKVSGRPFIKKFSKIFRLNTKRKIKNLDQLNKSVYCSNKGVILPKIREELLNIQVRTNVSKIKRSISYIKSNPLVGSNCLYSLCEKIENYYDIEEYKDIKNKLEIPHYEIEKISQSKDQDTVDIALFHDDHDYVAEGLLTHNTNPCIIYCLNSNTLLDHLTVVAHATGHNHFFKNNVFFGATDTNMINKMANNSTRIRKYMTRWGKEKVTEFIDNVLRLSTLVDGAKAWDSRQYKEEKINDTRHYYYLNKLKVEEGHLYMDPFVNTKGYIDKEKEKVKVKEKADELELFKNPTRDILGFLKDSAPLKPWQSDVIAMLYEEALYFFPQRQTKMLNEGCASIADHVIMSRQGYVGLGQESDDCGIIEYSQHKMGVLGGKYSTNPYKLGFNLLLDIEERWNKGKFGTEYEDCTDLKKKENWDQKLMLGKEKVFEVIRCHNDYTAINEFFTEDFCNKYEFFEWKRYPNGEYKIESRDYKKIKKKLLGKYLNSNLPDIRLTDCNFNGDGSLMLQHYDEGRFLHRSYLYEVLNSIAFIWKNKVHLASYNKDGEEEVFTSIDGQIEQNSREEFESKYDRYPSRGE